MLEHANLIVTARDESGALIGVARSLTDFAYCCYLSDIAVDRDWQRQRIGQRLIEETRRLATRQAKLILLTAPDAAGYYPHIGMTNATNCWVMERV
ncbi:MAG: GNAT family N-acetyltransferase [Polyangiales bacterium]|nr:GNAT family N-acetyltransferase [Myxococcales bacterium]